MGVADSAVAAADELAYDASWPGVRLAVVEGVVELLDNPLALPVVRKALPQLAPLLGDTAPQVGQACMYGAGVLV
jgi:hypothetical protein